MDLDRLRAICRRLPGTTQDIQWGNDLLFRIGGKIYVSSCLDPASPARLSFKCAPEEFAELTEKDGIVPAAYVARYHWVTLERWDALSDTEIERFIRNSYELVRASCRKNSAPKHRKRPASVSAGSAPQVSLSREGWETLVVDTSGQEG